VRAGKAKWCSLSLTSFLKNLPPAGIFRTEMMDAKRNKHRKKKVGSGEKKNGGFVWLI
jgi:hypothetical protein